MLSEPNAGKREEESYASLAHGLHVCKWKYTHMSIGLLLLVEYESHFMVQKVFKWKSQVCQGYALNYLVILCNFISSKILTILIP